MTDTTQPEVQHQVRDFYDQVGWQKSAEGLYQNARYEDLRPVSAEYIQRCHARVKRVLPARGRFLLDAGSGPVQYEAYLAYSSGHQYRVCVDLSTVALQEARHRLGEHGLYVAADVSRLPFRADAFEGTVSLHTLHHLPVEDQFRAYDEIRRTLAPGSSAAVVNGWTESALMRSTQGLVSLAEALGSALARLRGKPAAPRKKKQVKAAEAGTGTYTRKLDAQMLRRELSGFSRVEILPWRSVSPRWMRALVHRLSGGKCLLRLLFALEERFPRWFGEKGQYPLIVLYK